MAASALPRRYGIAPPARIKREISPEVRLARLVLLAYSGVYYAIPMVLTVLFGQPLEQVLAGPPNYYIGSAYIIVVVGLIWLLLGRLKLPSLSWIAPVAHVVFHRFVILGISLLYLYLSLQFARELGLSFRQTGGRIGDTGMFVIVLLIAQNYLTAAMLVLLGRSEESIRSRGWPLTIALMATALGSFLSLASAFGVVTLGIAVLLLVRNAVGWDLLRSSGRAKSILTFGVLTILVLGALFVGIANKQGIDTATYMFTSDIRSLIERFQYRISWHFYSASFHATFNMFNFQLGFDALQQVLSVIWHRVDVLLGNPTQFDEISSVRRLNWDELSLAYRAKAGASPGMVAGTLFVPGGIFALPISVLIYSTMLAMLARAAQGRSFSVIGLVFLIVYFASVADSSIDLLNPIDPAFLKLLFLLLASAFPNPASLQSKHERIAQPAPVPRRAMLVGQGR